MGAPAEPDTRLDRQTVRSRRVLAALARRLEQAGANLTVEAPGAPARRRSVSRGRSGASAPLMGCLRGSRSPF
jgi:hypothetical protein